MNSFRSTDETLLKYARDIWLLTYKIDKSDAYAMKVCGNLVDGWRSKRSFDDVVTSHRDTDEFAFLLLFAAKWAQCGYPKLVAANHKYTAALAATQVDRAFADELHLPGPCFEIVLPNGILEVPFVDGKTKIPSNQRGGVRDYTRILVGEFESKECSFAMMLCLDSGSKGGIISAVISNTLSDILFGELDEYTFEYVGGITSAIQHNTNFTEEVSDVESKNRMRLLARRIVVGLLLAMNDNDNFTDVTNSSENRQRRRRNKEPSHRIIKVGRPIDIDCRSALKLFLEGPTSGGHHLPPSVQTLVRGHHKRQFYGPGRTQRKILWIEPYWRGPEEALILARPHRLGGVES